MKTSDHLQVGQLYSRNDLREQFDISDATINTGTFQPAGHDSVWLFVTEEKTADRTQYEDHLDGDDLYFEGQTKGRTDGLIREHETRGLELLLFHRKRKDEHANYAFRYEGPFHFVSAEQGEPTKFHLQRASATMPTELTVVESINAIEQNIRRFHRDVPNHLERARSLATGTTYWVYDQDQDEFGPAKFVGFEGMTFLRYENAVDGNAIGVKFDGHVTRQAIEKVTGAFCPNSDLASRLGVWMQATFGSGTISGIDTEKWQFVELKSQRDYWTFVCVPDKYDGMEAVAHLDEISWQLDNKNPQPGDRAAIWQAKGKAGRRGIIALGEIISPPMVVEETPEELKYWKSDAPTEAYKQSRIRLIKAPGLPLWEDEHPDLLPHLAAARARGGTVFTLQPEQWHAMSELARNSERAELPIRKVSATGQGYGLTAAERRAVELHAQALAENHFLEQGYDVKDVSRTSSFDLLCVRGAEELHVEVKGTTGGGQKVYLTRNEVKHAEELASQVVLFVVKNVDLDRSGTTPVARGGKIVLFQPWEISLGTLEPVQFEYTLPPGGAG